MSLPDFAIPGLMPAASPVYSGDGSGEPLRLQQGVTFLQTWRIAMPEGEDLTDHGVRAECRINRSDPEPSFDLSPTISDPEGCIIRFEKTDEQTAELPVGMFWSDVLLDKPDGSVEKIYTDLLVIVSACHTQLSEVST